MQYYRQTELFQLLAETLRDPQLKPNAAALSRYKINRLNQAERSIRSRNILLYTEGYRASVALAAVSTIYTQPVGRPLIVVGYSDNLRYGFAHSAVADKIYPQAHRVRIIGPNGERALCEDFYFSQAGVSGEARYTEPRFTAPLILAANEQFAIDLSYDTAAEDNAVDIPPQAFVFYCVEVKAQLTADDHDLLEECRRSIDSHDYQRQIYLNAGSQEATSIVLVPDAAGLVFDSAIAGGVANGKTRPANTPILITGIGTTLGASRIKITDTGTGYSFSLNRPMQSSALNMPDDEETAGAPIEAPAGAVALWSYVSFPVPHLLKPGAQLLVEAVNGGDAGAGIDSILDDQFGNFLIFQGVTV